jgi:hypothetical protein
LTPPLSTLIVSIPRERGLLPTRNIGSIGMGLDRLRNTQPTPFDDEKRINESAMRHLTTTPGKPCALPKMLSYSSTVLSPVSTKTNTPIPENSVSFAATEPLSREKCNHVNDYSRGLYSFFICFLVLLLF